MEDGLPVVLEGQGLPLDTGAWHAAAGGRNATNMLGLLVLPLVEWSLVELVGG